MLPFSKFIATEIETLYDSDEILDDKYEDDDAEDYDNENGLMSNELFCEEDEEENQEESVDPRWEALKKLKK